MATNIEEITKEIEDTGFYNLVKIGEGGFGIVYKGLWKKTTSDSVLVAVKTLKEQGELDKLIKEKSIMEAIVHKNIVRFFGVYNIKIGNSMTNAIVTEFMVEGSVEDFLKRKSKYSVKPLDILSIAIDAATGMRYLHENNIIHRDLAARNLLLTFDSDKAIVKVSDFGLSRKLPITNEQQDDYYHVVNSKNPIKWSAPEYFLKRQVSVRSDLWSFGVVLYELFNLCKKEPYEEWKNSAVIKRIMAGEKMYEYLQISDSPEDVQKLLNRCMSNDSHARPIFDEIILDLKKIKEIVQYNNIWSNLELDSDNNISRVNVYNKYSQRSTESQDVQPQSDKDSHISSIVGNTVLNFKENKVINKLYYEEDGENVNVPVRTQSVNVISEELRESSQGIETIEDSNNAHSFLPFFKQKRLQMSNNSSKIGSKVEHTFIHFAENAQSVHVAGEFNDWLYPREGGKIEDNAQWSMNKTDSGWKLVKSLESGKYEFKYVINKGERWENDKYLPSYNGNSSLVLESKSSVNTLEIQPSINPLILHLQEVKKKEARVSVSSLENIDCEVDLLTLNPGYKQKLGTVSFSNEKDYIPEKIDYNRKELDILGNEKDYIPENIDYNRQELDVLWNEKDYIPENIDYNCEKIDVSRYDQEAKRWFEMAKKGNPVEQYKIGYCYYNGTKGVTQDYETAVFWYEKAASKGHAEAQNSLGNCYKKGGRGVPQDSQKAIYWFNLAAAQGHASAQFNLGFCYQEIAARCQEPQKTQNYQKAVVFYKEANQQNHQEAPFYLGILYEKGWGVSANREAAMEYYVQAKSRGFKKAQERIEKLNSSEVLRIKRQ